MDTHIHTYIPHLTSFVNTHKHVHITPGKMHITHVVMGTQTHN